MSTLVTILYGDNYHLYYDYADGLNHLSANLQGYAEFIDRVAKILRQCPLSDSGIHSIDLIKGSKIQKVISPECSLMRKLNRKVKKINKKELKI